MLHAAVVPDDVAVDMLKSFPTLWSVRSRIPAAAADGRGTPGKMLAPPRFASWRPWAIHNLDLFGVEGAE